MRKKLSLLMIIVMCFLSIPSPLMAQGYQREIVGSFGDIRVKINNVVPPLASEPFIYEGQVYLPLKTLSSIMGFGLDYKEGDQKISINTKGNTSESYGENFALELLKMNHEIIALNKSIEDLGGRGQEHMDTLYDRVTTANEMIAYLRKYYGILEGVPLSLDFRSPDDNEYILYVYIPHKYREDFERISQRSIRFWLEDIYFAIREHFDFAAEISGLIKDQGGTDKTYLVFDSRKGSLDIDFREGMDSKPIDINKRDLQEHLHDKLSSYDKVDFHYEVSPNRYDLDLRVYFDDNRFYNWSNSRQKSFLDKLRREIKSYKNGLYVYGSLIDDGNGETVSHFVLYEDNAEFRDAIPKNPLPPRENKKNEDASKANKTLLERSLRVWVNNPRFSVDGKSFSPWKEVLLVDNEIYMALSDLGDALYWGFDYNPDKAEVSITASHSSATALSNTLFAEASAEKARLLKILEETKEDVAKRDALTNPYEIIRTVGRMESYLKEYFERFEGIDTSISFSDSGKDHYRLRITYPSGEYNNFKTIRRNIIEGWIEEILDTVRELYNPYATISGSIRSRPYEDEDSTYISFDTEERRLTFDFEDHENEYTSNRNVDTREIERALDRKLWRFAGVPLRYEVLKNRRDVDLNIYFSHNRFYDWDIFEKMDFLEELYEEVRDVYSFVKVNGRMIDQYKDSSEFSFSLLPSGIRSFDLLQDLEKYLDEKYNKYSTSGDKLYFNYSIHEKSNSLDLIMEGDFFQSDDSWSRIGGNEDRLEEFEGFVLDLKDFVEDLWKLDVKVEVVDKAFSSLLIK